MKIYHTETQADYDALMIELEEQGCKWSFGEKPSGVNHWGESECLTCVRVYDSELNHASLDYYKKDYPSIPITKYKAKTDEKMRFNKQNIERAFDEFMQGGNDSFADLKERIINLADE